MDEDSDHRSELGLKKYWDSHYHEEIDNFEEHGDVGEIWFGRAITSKVVSWIVKNFSGKPNTRIIDIGCGNGFMLTCLLQAGFTNLTGVDYSEDAIVLSRKIASTLENGSNINYERLDILSDEANDRFRETFDVVLDKGTLDAICLNPEIDDIHSLVQRYFNYIKSIMKPLGYFIICSCNSTQEELCKYFDKLNLIEAIPSASIQFGGKQGNRVTCLVFQKNGD